MTSILTKIKTKIISNMTEDFQSESARLIALRLIDSTNDGEYKAIGKKTKRKDAEITEFNSK